MKRSQPPIGPSTLRALATEFKSRARDQGLDLVGITEAEPSRQAQFFSSWVQAGYHGGMTPSPWPGGQISEELRRR